MEFPPNHPLDQEAILLLYLAAELPAADREEIERMLESDPNLRSELDQLRQVQEAAHAALRQSDAQTGRSEPAAGRAAGEIERWAAHRASPRLAGASRARSWSIPRWAYPIAAAAVLAIAFVAWWGVGRSAVPDAPPVVQNDSGVDMAGSDVDQALVESLEDSMRMDIEQWTLDAAGATLTTMADERGDVNAIFFEDERIW
jgi:anti-sigma factor RsiW